MGGLRRRDVCRARGRSGAATGNPPAAGARAYGRAPGGRRRDRRRHKRTRRRRGRLIPRARQRHDRRTASRARPRSAYLALPRAGAEDPGTSAVGHGPPPAHPEHGYLAALKHTDALVGQCQRPDALLAVKHGPADVVPQPLVVEYELADGIRELVALPPALESPCALALTFRRGGACGPDRIGGGTELVRRDVCDDRRLAGSVRGMAWRPAQISGRGHCMASCRACLGHGDLTARPGPPEFDRATRSQVLRPSRLEEVQDVFRARCRPQAEEMVIRISEGPTAADRHETRVAFF